MGNTIQPCRKIKRAFGCLNWLKTNRCFSKAHIANGGQCYWWRPLLILKKGLRRTLGKIQSFHTSGFSLFSVVRIYDISCSPLPQWHPLCYTWIQSSVQSPNPVWSLLPFMRNGQLNPHCPWPSSYFSVKWSYPPTSYRKGEALSTMSWQQSHWMGTDI